MHSRAKRGQVPPEDGQRQTLVPLNDLARQWEEIRADALAGIDRVGRSGWFVLGDEVRTFEHELARQFDVTHAIGVASGLDAIEIALRASGLTPGTRVLTTPLSAFATTLAILRAGAEPVFVDTDDSGLLDLEQAASVLAERPDIGFAVPVHLYGHAMHLAELARLTERFGTVIVEDCAQAIGATHDGRHVGTVGAASATSFYPTKNLPALGDGGAVLTSSDHVATAARKLRDYGQRAKYDHELLGLNSRLDEVQAAILNDALLPRLAATTRRRRAIAARYVTEIEHPAVQPLPQPDGSDSVWHLFPVLVSDGRREQFASHLAAHGISTAVHYPRLIPDQSALADLAGVEVVGELRRARRIAEQVVSLPIHPYLTDDEVNCVVAATNAWSE